MDESGWPPLPHFLLFPGGEPAQREPVGAPAPVQASPGPPRRAGRREANATGFRALACCRPKPASPSVAPYGRAAVSRLAAPPERVRNGRNVPGTLHVHPLFRGTGRWGLESSIADRKARVEDCRTRRFRTVRRLPDCRQRRRPGRRRAGLGTAARPYGATDGNAGFSRQHARARNPVAFASLRPALPVGAGDAGPEAGAPTRSRCAGSPPEKRRKCEKGGHPPFIHSDSLPCGPKQSRNDLYAKTANGLIILSRFPCRPLPCL